MQWVAEENTVSECLGMKPEHIPEQLPQQIHFLSRHNSLFVRCENISGYFSCGDNNYLKIVPKYPKLDPFDMAAYVQQEGITSDDISMREGMHDTEFNIQTIIHSYIESLKQIAEYQIKIQRKKVESQLKSVRGHVNWQKTLRNFKVSKYQIDTSIREASIEIPENIILSLASRKILDLFSPSDSDLIILKIWANRCKQYSADSRTLDYLSIRLGQAEMSGAHAFYQRPIALAKVLLGIYGGTAGEQFTIAPMLFNTPGLYEEFIRTIFLRKVSRSLYSCQKGFSPRAFLFSNNDCEMIPDITIYRGNSVKVICDVKYKKPDAKDFYQLYAYMRHASLNKCYIITPEDVRDFEESITMDGLSVSYLKMDNTDVCVFMDKLDHILSNVN